MSRIEEELRPYKKDNLKEANEGFVDFRLDRHDLYFFPNGYGASVIYHKSLHFYGFYSEIAVLKVKNKEKKEYEICYDSGLTEDVNVVFSKEAEEEFLMKIKNLEEKSKNESNHQSNHIRS